MEHIKPATTPWRITDANQKGPRQIVGADGAVVARLTALDMPNAEFIVACVNAAPVAAAAPGADKPECAWRYDEDDCAWETACGEYYQFNEGTPSDNNAKFCHGCGKPILEMYPASDAS